MIGKTSCQIHSLLPGAMSSQEFSAMLPYINTATVCKWEHDERLYRLIYLTVFFVGTLTPD